MKIHSVLTTLAMFATFAVGTASATTTLVFSSAGTGRLSGLADHLGTPTDGMRWGIIIDTAGDGFDNTLANMTYDSFVNSSSGFISTTSSVTHLSAATDDYFFTPAALPTTSTQSATGTETGSQVGSIVSAASAPNGTDGLIPGVTTGDAFAIIWFESTPAAGSYYGTLNIPAFTLPASGTSVSFASNFTGNDASRPAGYQFTNVPEPSRALLLGFGALGLMFRRRRA